MSKMNRDASVGNKTKCCNLLRHSKCLSLIEISQLLRSRYVCFAVCMHFAQESLGGWHVLYPCSGCKCNSFEDASMLLEELRLFDNQVYGVVHGLLKGHGQNVWLQARSLFDKVNEMDGSAASSFYNALTNMLRCSGTLVRKYHTDIVKAKFWN